MLPYLGATEDALQTESKNIYYFKKEDMVYIKVKGTNEIIEGIILETCNEAMEVEDEKKQIIGIYTQLDKSNIGDHSMSGKSIIISKDGTFEEEKEVIEKEEKRGVLAKAGDACARFLNSIADSEDKIKIESTREEIESNKEAMSLIQPGDFESESNYVVLKDITIEKTKRNKKGIEEEIFNKNTMIPDIRADLYSLNMNIYGISNINFLNKQEKNNSKIFSFVQNIVLAYSKIIVYIAVSMFIACIIIKAISRIVNGSSKKPEEKAKEKKLINSIVRAVIMVSIIFIIVSLIGNTYEMVMDAIKEKFFEGKETPYTIRVHVRDTYSFNTNIIGLSKYLSYGGRIWYYIFSYKRFYSNTIWSNYCKRN